MSTAHPTPPTSPVGRHGAAGGPEGPHGVPRGMLITAAVLLVLFTIVGVSTHWWGAGLFMAGFVPVVWGLWRMLRHRQARTAAKGIGAGALMGIAGLISVNSTTATHPVAVSTATAASSSTPTPTPTPTPTSTPKPAQVSTAPRPTATATTTRALAPFPVHRAEPTSTGTHHPTHTATAQPTHHPTHQPTTGTKIGVHPGAFCSPEGDHDVSVKGTPMVCEAGSDGRNRWRHA